MIKLITSPILTFPVLLLGFGNIGFVLTLSFINIFFELVNIVYSIKYLKIRFIFSIKNNKLFKDLFSFSFFIFINLLINEINWNIDKYLIGVLIGPSSVAVYGIAAQFNSYFLILSTSISNVFIPRANNLIANKEKHYYEINNLFIKIGRIQFFVLSLFLTGFIFFGLNFLNFWVGSNYILAYPITLILLFSVIFPLTQNIGIEIQRALNKHKFRLLII
jgi:O-antigen/teichoic acid export membrane protein